MNDRAENGGASYPVLAVCDDESTRDELALAMRTQSREFDTVASVEQASAWLAEHDRKCIVLLHDACLLDLRPDHARRARLFTCRSTFVILVTDWSDPSAPAQRFHREIDEYISLRYLARELIVRLRTADRRLANADLDELVLQLAKLAEARDAETGAHVDRVREFCRILTLRLADDSPYEEQIDEEFLDLIYRTSSLHDIGKVGVPDRILLKPDRLDDDELALVQEHTVMGGRALDAAAKHGDASPYLQMARDIAWCHHERYDGQGYPHGLAAEAIPLAARIVAVADVYDALTTERVYRPAYGHDVACEIILGERGKQFDPFVVDAFRDRAESFANVRSEIGPVDPGIRSNCLPSSHGTHRGNLPVRAPHRRVVHAHFRYANCARG